MRAALTHAVTEEEISKNVASLVKVPKPRRRWIKPWSVVEAGRFLADSRRSGCGMPSRPGTGRRPGSCGRVRAG